MENQNFDSKNKVFYFRGIEWYNIFIRINQGGRYIMKEYVIFYRSRYFPLEGIKKKKVKGYKSKQDIRNNWHDIIGTDEYTIKKIEEVDKYGNTM
ncbi:MAG: hypothetical protein K0Q47_41 [Sedimentibacter sp.]|jgi:hypothetical protein|nr:hypothetical protein [Sedimentibacter sp.]